MSSPTPHVVYDWRGVLQLLSDGTVVRSRPPPPVTAEDPLVIFKDTQFDSTHNLTLRLYKPRMINKKLPILFYFHGGGFCLGSRTWGPFHAACLRLAASLPAVVVAPDYRLAPEFPLPAAVIDAASALDWIQPGSDPFLSDADFDNIFVSGESAGANLAHHMNLRFGSGRVNGYVLIAPFFGGAQRTASEEELGGDGKFLSLEMNDRFWRLALPRGTTRDDPLANPFGDGGPRWEEAEVGPAVVVVGGADMLRDRAVDYARRLRGFGKRAETVVVEEEEHGFFCMSPMSKGSDELLRVMKRFMEENLRVAV